MERYEGQFINGLKSGVGIQVFNNGSEYYGHFRYDYMDGTGVMILPDNEYTSGNMYLDSFDFGVRLYPNKTLVTIRKIKAIKIETTHEIQIETGKTKCKYVAGEKTPSMSCTIGKNIEELPRRIDYRYKGDKKHGFKTEELKNEFYRNYF